MPSGGFPTSRRLVVTSGGKNNRIIQVIHRQFERHLAAGPVTRRLGRNWRSSGTSRDRPVGRDDTFIQFFFVDSGEMQMVEFIEWPPPLFHSNGE